MGCMGLKSCHVLVVCISCVNMCWMFGNEVLVCLGRMTMMCVFEVAHENDILVCVFEVAHGNHVLACVFEVAHLSMSLR